MKEVLISFYKYLLICLFAAAIIYVPLSSYSKKIIERTDKRFYMDFAKNKSNSYVPFKYSLSAELYMLNYMIYNFKPANNIIFFGASNTQNGVIADNLILPAKWTLYNCAEGITGKTIYNYSLFFDLIEKNANHVPDKNDIIVLHLHCRTFTDNKNYLKELQNNIELFGYFKVDKNNRVQGSLNKYKRFWKTSNFAIRLACSLFIGYDTYLTPDYRLMLFIKDVVKEKFSHTKKKAEISSDEKFFSNEEIESFKKYFLSHMGETKIPGNTTEEFFKLINLMKKKTNIAVVNLYDPSWYDDLKIKQDYVNWLNNTLEPFLRSNSIPYIDFMRDIPDTLYYDQAHLIKKGREKYTALFNNWFPQVLDNISPDTNQIK